MAAATRPLMMTSTGNSTSTTTMTIAPATAVTLLDFGVPVAPHEVVVDEPARLHQRVADRAADEAEPFALELLAHAIRRRRGGGHVGHLLPPVLHGHAVDEAPQHRRETVGQVEHGAGVGDGTAHLGLVADDAGVLQQAADVVVVEGGDRS